MDQFKLLSRAPENLDFAEDLHRIREKLRKKLKKEEKKLLKKKKTKKSRSRKPSESDSQSVSSQEIININSKTYSDSSSSDVPRASSRDSRITDITKKIIKEQNTTSMGYQDPRFAIQPKTPPKRLSIEDKRDHRASSHHSRDKKKDKNSRSRKPSDSDIRSVSSEEIININSKTYSDSSSSDVPHASSRITYCTKEIFKEQKNRSIGYQDPRLAKQPKTPPKRLSIEDKRDHRASSHHSRVSERERFSQSYREDLPRSNDRLRSRASPQRFPDRHRSRDKSDRYKSRRMEPGDRGHRSPSTSDYWRASRMGSRDRSVKSGVYKEGSSYEDKYSRKPSGKEEHGRSSYRHHSVYRSENKSKREYSKNKSVDNRSNAHDSFTERLYNDKQKTYKWKESNKEDRADHNRYEYSNKTKEQEATELEYYRNEDEPSTADQLGDILDEVLQDFGADSMSEEVIPPWIEETKLAFNNNNVKITINENRKKKYFITIKLLWKELRKYNDNTVHWKILLYVLRQILEQQIEPILVGVEERLKAKELRDLYRSHYPRSGDAAFIKQVLIDICEGNYNDPEVPANNEQTENSETQEPGVCTVTIKKEPDSDFEDNENDTAQSVISTVNEEKLDVTIDTIKKETDSDATNISNKEVNEAPQSQIEAVKMDVEKTSLSHTESIISTVNKEKPDMSIDTIKKEPDSNATNTFNIEVNKIPQYDIATVKMEYDKTSSSHTQSVISTVNKDKPIASVETQKKESANATNIFNKEVNKTSRYDIATVKMEYDETSSSHTQSVISTVHKDKPVASVVTQKKEPDSNATNISNKEVNKTSQFDIATVKIEVDDTSSSHMNTSKADAIAKTSSKSKQIPNKSTVQTVIAVKNEPTTPVVKVENNTDSLKSVASNSELQARKRKKEKNEKKREKKHSKEEKTAPVPSNGDSIVIKSETADSSHQKRETKDDDVLVVAPKPDVIDLSDADDINNVAENAAKRIKIEKCDIITQVPYTNYSSSDKLNDGVVEIAQETQDGEITGNVQVNVENMEMDSTPAQDVESNNLNMSNIT